MLNRFGNKLWAKLRLANIVDLTQGSKLVWEYAVEFELNIGRLGSSNEVTPMHFFIWGLHKDIAERLFNYPPNFPVAGNSFGRGK